MSLLYIADRLILFYGYLIFGYVILSWFAGRGGTVYEIYKALGTIVEPYVGLFRRFIPMAAVGGAGLDFSPLVAWFVLEFVIRRLLLWGLIAPAVM